MVLWRHEGGAMPRKGHTEEQIVYALRQVEGGKKVSEDCREDGSIAAGVLQVEATIWRIGIERSTGASATAGRESQAERDCGGPHVG